MARITSLSTLMTFCVISTLCLLSLSMTEARSDYLSSLSSPVIADAAAVSADDSNIEYVEIGTQAQDNSPVMSSVVGSLSQQLHTQFNTGFLDMSRKPSVGSLSFEVELKGKRRYDGQVLGLFHKSLFQAETANKLTEFFTKASNVAPVAYDITIAQSAEDAGAAATVTGGSYLSFKSDCVIPSSDKFHQAFKQYWYEQKQLPAQTFSGLHACIEIETAAFDSADQNLLKQTNDAIRYIYHQLKNTQFYKRLGNKRVSHTSAGLSFYDLKDVLEELNKGLNVNYKLNLHNNFLNQRYNGVLREFRWTLVIDQAKLEVDEPLFYSNVQVSYGIPLQNLANSDEFANLFNLQQLQYTEYPSSWLMRSLPSIRRHVKTYVDTKFTPLSASATAAQKRARAEIVGLFVLFYYNTFVRYVTLNTEHKLGGLNKNLYDQLIKTTCADVLRKMNREQQQQILTWFKTAFTQNNNIIITSATVKSAGLVNIVKQIYDDAKAKGQFSTLPLLNEDSLSLVVTYFVKQVFSPRTGDARYPDESLQQYTPKISEGNKDSMTIDALTHSPIAPYSINKGEERTLCLIVEARRLDQGRQGVASLELSSIESQDDSKDVRVGDKVRALQTVSPVSFLEVLQEVHPHVPSVIMDLFQSLQD